MTLRDPLQRLINDADRDLQLAGGAPLPAELRISVADLQARTAGRSARRFAIATTVMLAGAFVLAWFGGWSAEHVDRVQPVDRVAKLAATPTAAANRSSIEVNRDPPVTLSLTRIDREAAFAMGEAKAIQHEWQHQSLRKQLRSVTRDRVRMDPRSALERAAQLRLGLAAELDRQFGGNEVSMREYKEIIERFPETTSAVTARDRLAHGGRKL